MFLFRSKKATMKEMQFATKAEAFAYMLKYQLEERKADPMTAAEKAGEFAEIFSQNMGVPEKLTPKPEGLVWSAAARAVAFVSTSAGLKLCPVEPPTPTFSVRQVLTPTSTPASTSTSVLTVLL